MLKNWNDSIGKAVKNETGKCIDNFNDAKKQVEYAVKDLEYELTSKFEITSYSNEIESLRVKMVR